MCTCLIGVVDRVEVWCNCRLPKVPIDLLRDLLRARGTLGPPRNALGSENRLCMAIYLPVSKLGSKMHYESSMSKKWQLKMRICSGDTTDTQDILIGILSSKSNTHTVQHVSRHY
jgi:hypothetical protein